MKTSALLFIVGALVAGAATQTYTGLITDTMCGNNHTMMKVTPDSKCVRECVKHGSKYALYDGKNAYTLSDQKTPEQFAGQKVTVTGTLYQKTNILKVDSIKAAQGETGQEASPHAGHSGHQH